MSTASRVLLPGALLAAATLCAAAPARAQSTNFYLDRAQISGAPDDGFMVWRPTMFDKTRFYGSWALGYSQRPLRADTVTDGRLADRIESPVQEQLITYLMVGTQIANRLGFNVSVPISLYQGFGADATAQNVGNGSNQAAQSLHDTRLDLRVRAYTSDNRKLSLGFGGALFVPTGQGTAFTGDGQTTGYLYGSMDYNFGGFLIAGTLGPHFRPARSIDGSAATLAVGNELRYNFGAYLPLRSNAIRLGAELWGTAGLGTASGKNTTFSSKNTDIEWLGQVRVALGKTQHTYINAGAGTRLYTGYGGPDFRVLASIGTFFTIADKAPKTRARGFYNGPDVSEHPLDTDGDGYPDDIDQCPTVKEDGKPPDPTDGCPAPSDRDGDGIPDNIDKCPDVPEDKDGIQDNDGCPEDDADNDGVPDTKDHCPTEPGPASKIAEKNGCPQLTHVNEEGEVELLEPIQFEFAKSRIKAVSYPILDEVVTLMKSRPDIRIGVYGHTDNKGAHDLNMKLSGARAKAVMDYLVSHGIAASRLESQGFGPDKPIASNDTPQGRAKNRRVEFKILGGEGAE